MIRRAALFLLGLVTVVATCAPGAAAEPATRGQDTAGRFLALTDTSAWVDPEGTWRVDWTVVAEPPADATLRYTIHQAISGPTARQKVEAALAGGALGPNLRSAQALPFAQVRSGSQASVQIPVRSRSGSSDRVLLPNAGIHPVEISLVAGDGTELQTMVLFLNRLPASPPPALRVAPLFSLVAPPLVSPDGIAALPEAARASVGIANSLLGAAGDVPITVRLDPEIVAASGSSPDPTDGTRLAGLLGAIGERSVLRSTWAPMDLESWAIGGSLTSFQTSVLAGQQTLTDALERSPDGSVWGPDPTIGPVSMGWLSAVGVQHLLVEADQVAPTRDLGVDSGTTQRFMVETADSGIDGLVIDPVLDRRLAADADPALVAHHAATELEAMWFATPEGATPAAVVDLSDVPSTVARAFLAELAEPNPSIDPSSVGTAFEESTASPVSTRRRSEPLVRKVVHAGRVTDVSAISRELARLRTRAASFHSSMRDAEGQVPLEQLLLTVQHRDLPIAEQLTYLAAAGRSIDEGLAFVVPPESRSFTVTARRSELPIRITNNGDRDVTVLLRFGGTRLQVNGGRPLRVTLRPGPNSITVPVLARTSGEFTMLVEVRTADDSLQLSSTEVRIRSTVVSGVGVVLAVGALSFLLVWWGVTIRRDRRSRPGGPANDADPTVGAPPSPTAASIA